MVCNGNCLSTKQIGITLFYESIKFRDPSSYYNYRIGTNGSIDFKSKKARFSTFKKRSNQFNILGIASISVQYVFLSLAA